MPPKPVQPNMSYDPRLGGYCTEVVRNGNNVGIYDDPSQQCIWISDRVVGAPNQCNTNPIIHNGTYTGTEDYELGQSYVVTEPSKQSYEN